MNRKRWRPVGPFWQTKGINNLGLQGVLCTWDCYVEKWFTFLVAWEVSLSLTPLSYYIKGSEYTEELWKGLII